MVWFLFWACFVIVCLVVRLMVAMVVVTVMVIVMIFIVCFGVFILFLHAILPLFRAPTVYIFMFIYILRVLTAVCSASVVFFCRTMYYCVFTFFSFA